MLRNGKKFLDDRYREEAEEVDPEDVTESTFGWSTVDITYRSAFSGRTRTIRARSATTTTEYNDVPEGFFAFWDDGKKYAYSPDVPKVISLDGDNPVTVAEGDDVHRVEVVRFPQRPTVAGAVQEDVEATVYYWTDRSDELQDVTIDVDRVEETTDNPWRISGHDVTDDDRKIEAEVRNERRITSKTWGSNEVFLGRVSRVEFPAGHRFTVDLRGLPDDRARDAVENIKRRLTSRRGYDDVDVTHDGRIESK